MVNGITEGPQPWSQAGQCQEEEGQQSEYLFCPEDAVR